MLADLLALGVEPIASTATVPEAGFHALDSYDTSAIEPLPVDINLEYLASLEPDLIVTLELWLDYVPEGAFEGIAPTLVVPNGLSTTDQIRFPAEQFDGRERADELVAEMKAAKQTAAVRSRRSGGVGRGDLPGPLPSRVRRRPVDHPSGAARLRRDVGPRLPASTRPTTMAACGSPTNSSPVARRAPVALRRGCGRGR